jgi:hypothetical protein
MWQTTLVSWALCPPLAVVREKAEGFAKVHMVASGSPESQPGLPLFFKTRLKSIPTKHFTHLTYASILRTLFPLWHVFYSLPSVPSNFTYYLLYPSACSIGLIFL